MLNIKKVAELYNNTRHNPNDKTVSYCYQTLCQELISLYAVAKHRGFSIELINDDTISGKIKTSKQLFIEIDNCKQVKVLSTLHAFGQDCSALDYTNVMLRDSGLFDINGNCLTYNDLLRFCHDIYGHYAVKAGFNIEGELQAYKAHAIHHSEAAQHALAFEIVGQICYFNIFKQYAAQKNNIMHICLADI
jgi:hypothetical protein